MSVRPARSNDSEEDQLEFLMNDAVLMNDNPIYGITGASQLWAIKRHRATLELNDRIFNIIQRSMIHLSIDTLHFCLIVILWRFFGILWRWLRISIQGWIFWARSALPILSRFYQDPSKIIQRLWQYFRLLLIPIWQIASDSARFLQRFFRSNVHYQEKYRVEWKVAGACAFSRSTSSLQR